MKTTINKAGTLEIKSENELESYALGQWCNENIHPCTGQIKTENLIFYWGTSEYKSKQKVQLKSGEVEV